MSRRGLVWCSVGALAVAALALYWSRRPEPSPPPSDEELQVLSARRDALQARLQEVLAGSGELNMAVAPRGQVMIGIPTSFTRAILAEIVSGLFDHMTLTLRNLNVHKRGEVEAKVVLVRQTVGRYVLDAHILEVQGVLAAGHPEMTFGENRVVVALPVKLVAGSGRSDIRLQWDSQGLVANVVCGDTDVTRSVTGSVVPRDYVLNGAFRITGDGEAITLEPDFPKELSVRISVDPSAQAWQVLEEVVAAQRAGCRLALDRMHVERILAGIVERGFDVPIPRNVLQPVRIPAGIRRSLELHGVRIALRVTSTGLEVTPDRIWYGADVALERPPPGRQRPARR